MAEIFANFHSALNGEVNLWDVSLPPEPNRYSLEFCIQDTKNEKLHCHLFISEENLLYLENFFGRISRKLRAQRGLLEMEKRFGQRYTENLIPKEDICPTTNV